MISKFLQKKAFLWLLFVLCSFFAKAQTSNHVFSGTEANNYSVIDLATPSGQTWSTDRLALPGYFSATGGATYTGASDASHVNGYVKHYATASNQSFNFPIGSSTDYRSLSLSGTRAATSVIATAWIAGDPSGNLDPTTPNAGNHSTVSFGTGLQSVSSVGQWDWQDLSNDAAGVTVTVSIPNLSAYGLATELRLVGWNGSQWVNLSGVSSTGASGNTENSTLSGTMISGITAIGIGKATPATNPDLVISVGQPSPSPVAGQPTNLPVTVANIGSAPTVGNITAVVQIPNGTTFGTFPVNNNGWTCSTSGTTATCTNVGPLANNSSSLLQVPFVPTIAQVGGPLTVPPANVSGGGEPVANNTNNSSAPVITPNVDIDTDNDNIADGIDLDDDNDGILDVVENDQLSLNIDDIDADGIPNRLDLDSDNDGINDVIEGGGTDANKDGIADGTPNLQGIPATAGTGLTPPNTDSDSRPNPYDLDADNDGINDVLESGNPVLVDANGDGMVDGTDTDGDGIKGAADGTPTTRGDSNDPTPADTDGIGGPNYIDLDSDGDGLTDLQESGIPNVSALDANNDGKIDSTIDPDGDGIMSPVDGLLAAFGDANSPTLPDSNTNGTPDYVDALDTDNDNVPNTVDLDDDNDGILDTVELASAPANGDTDGDGIIDSLDLDSDNDGINDVREVSGTDANGDGLADGTSNAQGIPSSAGTMGLTPPDTDGDGQKDFQDLDSDNDTVSDLVESGSNAADTNSDGMVDGADTDNDGIKDAVDGKPNAFGDLNDSAPKNTDGTDQPDYRDPDSNNDGVNDIVTNGFGGLDTNGDGKVDNPTDPDKDGIANNNGLDTLPNVFGGIGLSDTDDDKVPNTVDLDDDNDGILDTVELASAPANGDTDGDGIIDSLDLDSDNDGINDVREASGTDANGDGLADGTSNAQGIPSSAGTTGLTPPDTDGDGQKDFQDLDSDNDTISDLVESGSNATDTDNDGIVDGADTDKDGIKDAVDGKPNAFADQNDSLPTEQAADTDNIPDYRDIDSNGISKDIVLNGFGGLDANGDGKVDNPTDPDKDGIANNNGLDTKPTVFGGLSSTATTTARVNVKVLLQGALFGTTGTIMRDDLRASGIIPTAQPYSTIGNTYPRLAHIGSEAIGNGVLTVTGNDAIVDWVLVELRDANNPATILKTKAALVQRDGDIVESSDGITPVTFVGVVGQSYYFAVKHRNHLGAMTATAIPMTATGTTVDFTTMTAAQLYNSTATYDGLEQVDVNGKKALWAGNANVDGKVKYTGSGNDQSPILNQVLTYANNTTQAYNYDLATPVYLSGDINMDGKVKYRGSGNDANFILNSVVNVYLLNTAKAYNFDLFVEQIP